MHLSAPEHGFMGASAIVGTTIPLAVGSAFAGRMIGNKKIAAVFFGDGAIDEGVFWESLNLACVMRLPVIFICEDNSLAVHSFDHARHGYRSIAKIVAGFDCRVMTSQSTDVERIHEITQQAIAHATKKQMPVFLHLKYYRYLEHVGVNEDFDAGYRSRKEFEVWKRKDPVALQRKKLLALGMSERAVKKLEHTILTHIEHSIVKAQKAPFPKPSDLMKHIFAS